MPTALPCFHLRMPASHDIITPLSSIILKLLSLPIYFVLPTTMPPFSVYKKIKHTRHFVSNWKYGQLLDVALAVLITITVIRLAVAYFLQRKSRAVSVVVEDLEKPITKPSLERQDSAISQQHWESDHENRLNSLKQEILQHTERPIHPWVLPPQALPGPYHPMYYPLPAPTVQCESSTPLAANPEGRHSTSYIHLVPNTCAPQNETILYGTLTTSTNGWRRTHWNVNGG